MVTRSFIRPTSQIRTRTARDFSGGWNTEDSSLNLSSRFLVDMQNVVVSRNGLIRVRYGTSEAAQVASLTEELIACEYYNEAVIAVAKSGQIWRATPDGTVSLIWSEAIANSRPGSPNGWSSITYAEFTQFAGELIITNGVDKPLIINTLNQVNYLQDKATGSNVWVPRAKHCTAFNDYLVLANGPDEPDMLYIGAKGAAGTFVNDPPPNDAVNFQTAPFIDRGNPSIRALAAFRDRLLVFFDEQTLVVQLGQYNSNNDHVPQVEDRLQGIGALSGRAVVSLGDDVVVLSRLGVESMKRTIITGQFSPRRLSSNIDTVVQRSIAQLSKETVADSAYAIHDRADGLVLFFVPKTNAVLPNTDNHVFVSISDGASPADRWSYYTDMPYRAACRSANGELFFVSGNQVWQYRNAGSNLLAGDTRYRDKMVRAQQPWSDDTTFTDATSWQISNLIGGTPISISFQTPWLDFGNPMATKHSRYVTVDYEAAGPPYASITMSAFIDRIEPAQLSGTFTVTGTPGVTSSYLLSTQNSSVIDTEASSNLSVGGLGGNSVQVVRPATHAQLYAWPATFRRVSFKFEGAVEEYFALVGLNVAFLEGGIRR